MKGLLTVFLLLGLLTAQQVSAAEYQSNRSGFLPPQNRFVLDVYNQFEAEAVRVYTNKSLHDSVEIVFAGWANNDNAPYLRNYINRGRTQMYQMNWDTLRAEFIGGIQKPACLQYRERLFKQPEVQGVCLIVDIYVPENTNVREIQRGVFEIELFTQNIPPTGYGYVSEQEFSIIVDGIRREPFVQNKEQRALNEIRNLEYRRMMLLSDQITRLLTDTGFGTFDVQEKLNVYESAARITPEVLPFDLVRSLNTFGSFESDSKLRVIQASSVRVIFARDLVSVLRTISSMDVRERLAALEALAIPLVRPTIQDRDMILREFKFLSDKQEADRILRKYGK